MSGRTRCAREGCAEAVEAPGRRFCAPHRREHGLRLLGQLQAIQDQARDPKPAGGAR